MGKRIINGAEKIRYLHAKEGNWIVILNTIKKTNSKCIKDLNLRPENKKHLEENIVKKLLDIGLGKDTLDMTQKHRQEK